MRWTEVPGHSEGGNKDQESSPKAGQLKRSSRLSREHNRVEQKVVSRRLKEVANETKDSNAVNEDPGWSSEDFDPGIAMP
jgi:hypothetical protein